jgi:hypothetical protein
MFQSIMFSKLPDGSSAPQLSRFLGTIVVRFLMLNITAQRDIKRL